MQEARTNDDLIGSILALLPCECIVHFSCPCTSKAGVISIFKPSFGATVCDVPTVVLNDLEERMAGVYAEQSSDLLSIKIRIANLEDSQGKSDLSPRIYDTLHESIHGLVQAAMQAAFVPLVKHAEGKLDDFDKRFQTCV